MKKYSFMEESKEFYKPMDLLGTNNRFECIDRLEETVRQKKGGYTEKEYRYWLELMYSCLAAPNSYWLDENDATQCDKRERKRQKQLSKYTMKLSRFRYTLKQEREQHCSVYTYLTCIRDLLNKIGSYKKVMNNPLAEELQSAVRQALDERISKNPKLETANGQYQKVLKETFQTNQDRLNHPVFFLFLPYYLFFELGKCEGLISQKKAFSVPQLSKNEFNWTIRYSPIKASSEQAYEQLDELYDLIENALCKRLHDCGYHSIGQTLFSAIYSYRDCYEYPETTEDQAVAFTDDKIEYAVDFSTPFWSYEVWAECLCEQFDITEINALLPDMHQLFNLTFRSSSEQSKRAIENILQKYVHYRAELNNRPFYLSELLDALCKIYNLQYFNNDPFESEPLRKAVDILLNFLIETGVYPVAIASDPMDVKWIFLLRYGCSNIKPQFDDINRCLINPGRILYRAIWMKSLADAAEAPMRYGLSDFFPYSNTIEKISNSLYHALCSQKAILYDISYWGGVQVELDKKYAHTLGEVFHIWLVWHTDAAIQFKDYFKYIENHSNYLSTALSRIQPFAEKPVIVDLSTFNFDTEKSAVLASQKQQLFNSISELKKIFGLPKNLDDFRYACILYFMFQTLRDRMCRQVFALYKKLLRLS